jgi:hypothetical protein
LSASVLVGDTKVDHALRDRSVVSSGETFRRLCRALEPVHLVKRGSVKLDLGMVRIEALPVIDPSILRNRRGTYLGTRKWFNKPQQGLQNTYYDTLRNTVAPLLAILETCDDLKLALPSQDLEDRTKMLRAQYYCLDIIFFQQHDELAAACHTLPYGSPRGVSPVILITHGRCICAPRSCIRHRTSYCITPHYSSTCGLHQHLLSESYPLLYP